MAADGYNGGSGQQRRQQRAALPGSTRLMPWWNSYFASRAKPSQAESTKVEIIEWLQKDATPVFLPFPVFFVPRLGPLLVFDGLVVFRQRGTKHTGYVWISPATF